jgi:epoxyqueuosine reductase
MMLAISYHVDADSLPPAASKGRVSRYAWGGHDYHDLVHKKLKQLCRTIKSDFSDVAIRGVIDTAPLLEREFAQLSGMGWFAKNTMLINRELGSWFFIAAVLIDQELLYDAPFPTSHCGTCTACIDQCPTGAFVEPGKLDATKCISYLTIEHRSPIPMELRDQMGDWILGCDVCQDVCPWNNKATQTPKAEFQPNPELAPLDLHELFTLDDDQFRTRFRKTPLWRPKRRGILRNAAIAIGNHPSPAGLRTLAIAINDSEPLVRGASAWAIGKHDRFDESACRIALSSRLEIEDDPVVTEEIQNAMEMIRSEKG